MEKEFVITNEQGIHARPATKLVQLANEFDSDLYLRFKGNSVDLKSIMGVLSLGVTRGSTITITAEGNDMNEALKRISKFITDLNN